MIGAGQSLWSRHVNLFLSNVFVYQLFVSFSVKRKKFVKQCLDGIVRQVLVALNFAIFVWKKKAFVEIYLKRSTSHSFRHLYRIFKHPNVYKVC